MRVGRRNCYFEASFSTRSSQGCAVEDAQRIFPHNGTIILDPNSTFLVPVEKHNLFSITVDVDGMVFWSSIT